MAKATPDIDFLIASLATTAARVTATMVAPYGLSPLEYGILDWCRREEANSVSELAKAFPADVSVISRHASRLVDRGLLSRRRPSNNRRRVELRLTEEGLSLAQRLEDPVMIVRARITEGIGDREWAAFTATALKILANLESMKTPPPDRSDGG